MISFMRPANSKYNSRSLSSSMFVDLPEQRRGKKVDVRSDIYVLGSAFGGGLAVTLNSYDISGEDIQINVTVNDNYGKDIELWQDGIYVMNNDGSKFSLDTFKHLEKGENKFSLVSGETKDFTFHFTGYVNSS